MNISTLLCGRPGDSLCGCPADSGFLDVVFDQVSVSVDTMVAIGTGGRVLLYRGVLVHHGVLSQGIAGLRSLGWFGRDNGCGGMIRESICVT